jgi:hypothetical protein
MPLFFSRRRSKSWSSFALSNGCAEALLKAANDSMIPNNSLIFIGQFFIISINKKYFEIQSK